MSEKTSSPAEIRVWLNGDAVQIPAGTMVSAVFLNAGAAFRLSTSGEPRAAVCGMGICFECRATVDGVLHQRTCQLACQEGMQLQTAL